MSVDAPRALKGRIVAIAEETERNPQGAALTTRHRVTVAGESGLEQFVLEEAEGRNSPIPPCATGSPRR